MCPYMGHIFYEEYLHAMVKVDNTFFIECNAYGANNNKQLLHNENGRPSVLVAKLHYYKGLHDFIIPMKSNIASMLPSS